MSRPLRRLDTGGAIAGVAAIGLMVQTFLPWYVPSVDYPDSPGVIVFLLFDEGKTPLAERQP